ncbi:hypothetical protein C7972_11756 [Arenibacter sp. ARW7G5Y1]|nr:hypothetical protein C7972_11756 [Arenibacter sp. ARW7G5Y1]
MLFLFYNYFIFYTSVSSLNLNGKGILVPFITNHIFNETSSTISDLNILLPL